MAVQHWRELRRNSEGHCYCHKEILTSSRAPGFAEGYTLAPFPRDDMYRIRRDYRLIATICGEIITLSLALPEFSYSVLQYTKSNFRST
jgi:hypothetical protein